MDWVILLQFSCINICLIEAQHLFEECRFEIRSGIFVSHISLCPLSLLFLFIINYLIKYLKISSKEPSTKQDLKHEWAEKGIFIFI